MSTQNIRFFDMFAGIGGFRAGLERAGGFTCIGHCEIDKHAEKAYRAIHNIKQSEVYYEERASRIFKATALSGNGKALAGEPGAEQVEVRHCFCVNFSCVFIINLAFFDAVDCPVSLFCVPVDL